MGGRRRVPVQILSDYPITRAAFSFAVERASISIAVSGDATAVPIFNEKPTEESGRRMRYVTSDTRGPPASAHALRFIIFPLIRPNDSAADYRGNKTRGNRPILSHSGTRFLRRLSRLWDFVCCRCLKSEDHDYR